LADVDIAQLYLITDLLITDYSSVMFDFANLDRPMLFYAYDLSHYRDQLRGFYFDYQAEIPGPLATDEAQMTQALDQFAQAGDFAAFRPKLAAFQQKYCEWETGTAAKQVVAVMNGGFQK
jgi:CDP-glycerol glycerophosphotransferase